MALTISENQGSFEELPEGKHNAVCYRIIDIGTHMELKFGSTTEYEKKHTVIFFWETLDEKMEDGRPFGVNRWYKLSLHEKSTLYRDLDTWKGGITNEELAGLKLPCSRDSREACPCVSSTVSRRRIDRLRRNVHSGDAAELR